MYKSNLLLGVNLDHVATLRQARRTPYPDMREAVRVAETHGADSITLHLREDRRHIQDDDVFGLHGLLTTRMNLEMAVTDEMLAIAARLKPADCCLVPERREELTTEGGLDVVGNLGRMRDACAQLTEVGIRVSPFIDPDPKQIEAVVAAGAPVCELHTGRYADAHTVEEVDAEFSRIREAAELGTKLGLQVNAGHGLHYENVARVAAIPELVELNIGHAIVARALFVGLAEAVREMKQAMLDARAYAA